MMDDDLPAVLEGLLNDPACAWMCGGFGAVAEFMRDPDEAVHVGPGLQAVTARGGVRVTLTPATVPMAYEMPGRRAGWSQALELCLPDAMAATPRRIIITELGPDNDALRIEDAEAILFDLGLGMPHAEFCVRTQDPETLDVLRSGCGIGLLSGNPAAAAMPRLSPHRVVRSPLGRIEVFQPIPPPDGSSPEGPHTHLLPKLLAHGRTHAANLPLPPGFVPCLSSFPANPLSNQGFDRRRFEAFQRLLDRYADPDWHTIKQAVFAGTIEPRKHRRHLAAALRVAHRQRPFVAEMAAHTEAGT